MSQQIVDNGDSGLSARTKINENFSELYNALLLPIKLPGINVNTNQAISANTFIGNISISPAAGTPTLRIGVTPNGQELLADTVIDEFVPVKADYYCAADTIIYLTLSGGGGSINVRLDVLKNFY